MKEMSPGCGNCGSTERTMTRGRFLATGLAATAGVTAAATGAKSVLGQQALASPQECAPELDPMIRWVLPAGILNALWNHAFPRIVAHGWEAQKDLGDFAGWDAGVLKLVTSPSPTNQADVGGWWNLNQTAAWPGSLRFRTHILRFLHEYLSLTTVRIVPIRIMGTGGYDCLLSNQGLDLFLPPKPRTKDELYRYYTFRRTGRRSIGVPGYLSGPVSGISLDSPTGPGQVRVRTAAVWALIGAGAPTPGCAEAVRICLEAHRDRELVGTEPDEDEEVSMSMEAYACLMDNIRPWQVAGSVYRGIMTELPRVVAEIWREKDGGCSLPADSYAIRFEDPSDGGLRDIFRERLETQLPRGPEMRFQQYPDTSGNTPQAIMDFVTAYSAGAGDVMITNNGVYVPATPTPPGETAMYAEMARGNAGNPVFTDSVRTT